MECLLSKYLALQEEQKSLQEQLQVQLKKKQVLLEDEQKLTLLEQAESLEKKQESLKEAQKAKIQAESQLTQAKKALALKKKLLRTLEELKEQENEWKQKQTFLQQNSDPVQQKIKNLEETLNTLTLTQEKQSQDLLHLLQELSTLLPKIPSAPPEFSLPVLLELPPPFEEHFQKKQQQYFLHFSSSLQLHARFFSLLLQYPQLDSASDTFVFFQEQLQALESYESFLTSHSPLLFPQTEEEKSIPLFFPALNVTSSWSKAWKEFENERKEFSPFFEWSEAEENAEKTLQEESPELYLQAQNAFSAFQRHYTSLTLPFPLFLAVSPEETPEAEPLEKKMRQLLLLFTQEGLQEEQYKTKSKELKEQQYFYDIFLKQFQELEKDEQGFKEALEKNQKELEALENQEKELPVLQKKIQSLQNLLKEEPATLALYQQLQEQKKQKENLKAISLLQEKEFQSLQEQFQELEKRLDSFQEILAQKETMLLQQKEPEQIDAARQESHRSEVQLQKALEEYEVWKSGVTEAQKQLTILQIQQNQMKEQISNKEKLLAEKKALEVKFAEKQELLKSLDTLPALEKEVEMLQHSLKELSSKRSLFRMHTQEKERLEQELTQEAELLEKSALNDEIESSLRSLDAQEKQIRQELEALETRKTQLKK
jgi:hypothetical protein